MRLTGRCIILSLYLVITGGASLFAAQSPESSRVKTLEQKVLTLETSLADTRKEMAALRLRLRAADRAKMQSFGELRAYRIVRGALDARTRQLAEKIKAEDIARQEKRAAQIKVADLTKEQKALLEENLELRRRINMVSDNFDRQKAAVYREVGAAYTDLNLVREAILAYDKSIFYDPRNPKGHYAIGVLYAAAGSGDKSIRHLKQYLSLVPYAANTKDVKYLINTLATEKGRE